VLLQTKKTIESKTMQPESKSDGDKKQFEQLADQGAPGFFAEFWDFLRNNKKWWLAPIVVILLMFGALVMLSGSAAAPFIYTLF
jgi:hypothetical protein